MPIGIPKRPVGDFYGPFFTVKFYPVSDPVSLTPDTPGASITSGPSVNGATPAVTDLDHFVLQSYCSQLEFESQMGGPLNFTLTLTPPLDVGLKILASRIIRYENLVSVQWGYAGTSTEQVSEKYYFKILQPEVRFEDSGDIIIILNGIDTTSHVLRNRVVKQIFKRNGTYSTDANVIVDLFQKAGYRTDATLIKRVDHPVYATKTKPVEWKESDWKTAQELCKINNITFVIGQEKTIYLIDFNELPKLFTDYTLRYRQQLQTNKDIPLRSFSANVDNYAAFISPEHKGLLSIIYNPDTGKIDTKSYTPDLMQTLQTQGSPSTEGMSSTKTKYQGPRTKVETNIINSMPIYGPKDQGKIFAQSYLASSTDGRAENIVRQISNTLNTKARVVIPGVPDFIPPLNVQLEGFEDSGLGGRYIVQSVKHTLGPSGYDVSAELFRTTTSETLSLITQKANPPPIQSTGAATEQGRSADNTSLGRARVSTR